MTAKRQRRWLLWAVVAAVVTTTLLLTLFIVPLVPTRVSGTLIAEGTCSPSCPALHPRESLGLPAGPTVKVTWAGTDPAPLSVTVTGPPVPGVVCSWTNASTGSCSFTSLGGNYTLLLVPPAYSRSVPAYTVDFTVEYWQPYL